VTIVSGSYERERGIERENNPEGLPALDPAGDPFCTPRRASERAEKEILRERNSDLLRGGLKLGTHPVMLKTGFLGRLITLQI